MTVIFPDSGRADRWFPQGFLQMGDAACLVKGDVTIKPRDIVSRSGTRFVVETVQEVRIGGTVVARRAALKLRDDNS